jgi:hypothetical protein
LNPVRGSVLVLEDWVAVAVELAAVDVVGLELAVVMGELEAEPVGAGLDAGALLLALLLGELEPEEPELGVGELPSGSVYWLSPADGPEASAAAGVSSITAVRARMRKRIRGTRRVSHPPPSEFVHAARRDQ